MSKAAQAYYEGRTALLASGPLPNILDGRARPIIDTRDHPISEMMGVRFRGLTSDVEPYVLNGARYTGGKELSDEEWEAISSSPRYGIASAYEYASGRMAAHLLTPLSLGCRVLLEAIADSEIPQSPYRRATENKPIARLPGEEMARVALLARSVAENGKVMAAHLTIIWGEHKVMPIYQGEARSTAPKGFLTPRYFGAPVLGRELSDLPPLVMY